MKRSVLLVLAIIAIVMISTGMSYAEDGYTAPPTYNSQMIENVKCVFHDTNEIQNCSLAEGDAGCTTSYENSTMDGIRSCIAQSSGYRGTVLTWKSSCEGRATTTIDGNEETIDFKRWEVASK